MNASIRHISGRISYPDIVEPACGGGHSVPVADGVHWLRMPLFTDSAAINCWALEDGEGWAVIDSGVHTPETVTAWQAAGVSLLGGRSVNRVFATHMHPDHSGMAGWIAREHGATLGMTRLEYLTLRMFENGDEKAANSERDFYRQAGMPAEWLAEFNGRAETFSRAISPVPPIFTAIEDGNTVRIGSREWTCVTGKGHSPEHACFWNPEDRLLISGDQVLPEISSNVSVLSTEPEADPLSDWLFSLDRIRTIVPDDVLVLPAHGRPFHGLHARIHGLIDSHERKLERLHAALHSPMPATDLFGALFRKVPENFMSRSLAVGEALAHLSCLRSRGQAAAETGADGVLRWRRR